MSKSSDIYRKENRDNDSLLYADSLLQQLAALFLDIFTSLQSFLAEGS